MDLGAQYKQMLKQVKSSPAISPIASPSAVTPIQLAAAQPQQVSPTPSVIPQAVTDQINNQQQADNSTAQQVQQQALQSLQQPTQQIRPAPKKTDSNTGTSAAQAALSILNGKSEPMATVDYQELAKEGFTPTQISQYMGEHPNTELKNAPDNWDANVSQSTIVPKAAPITEHFGQNQPGVEVFSHGFTSGTGIGVPVGTPVATPPGDWKVVDTNTSAKQNGFIGDSDGSGWGNYVLVENKDTGEQLRYSHLSDVGVANGDTISGNKVIGLSGQSGNVTGPHLNLEYVNQKGEPADVLQSQYAPFIPKAQ